MTKPWPMVPLGEVLIHRKEFIQIDDATIYKRCRVKLHAQGIVLRDEVPGAEIKTKKQQVCKAGEFLVAEIDAKVGGFGIVPGALDAAIVSSHYFLFQVIETALDMTFLDYFIRTPFFRDQVTAQGSTNYAAIRPKEVLGYKIPLPSLSEQKRIVARIEELAAKIEEAKGLRQKAIEEAEALLPSSLNSAIYDAALTMVPLESLCHQVRDVDHKMPAAIEEGIPYISPKDFRPGGAIDYKNAKKISTEDFENLSRKIRPEHGDILFARYGTIGEVREVSVDFDFTASYSIAIIKPNLEKANGRYLFYSLQAPAIKDKAMQGIRASAMADLGLKTIKAFNIPAPPLLDQRRIVAYLDDLQAKVDSLKRLQAETAVELNAMLPSVLDRAFKGEM